MIEEYIFGYKKLLLSKAEQENWEIVLETETDRQLCSLFFGELPKQKKMKKKMKLESLVYIVFGRNALDSLLNEGFKTLNKK